MKELAGKAAVITGGGAGLGAVELARDRAGRLGVDLGRSQAVGLGLVELCRK